MARKKKETKTPLPLKKIALFGFCIILLGVFVYGTYIFLMKSAYFSVKVRKIDSSLSYIDKRDLAFLINMNIFDVDLAGIQRRLELKYPQVSDLKIIRKFPNEILVIAKKRIPFAQVVSKDLVLTLDEFGTILSKSSKLNNKLPQVKGLKSLKDVQLGRNVGGDKMRLALDISREFVDQRSAFGSIKLESVDISKTSKIILGLSNKVEVMLGKENIGQKIKLLSVVLSQTSLNLNDVKYIDLRFKEPIVGKK